MSFDGLHIGHYILLRSIGSGGMGEVYLAEDPRIHRQVAIKVVRTEANAYPHDDSTKDAQRLFLREAKAIARLDHPHILPLFDYGEETVNGTMLTYLVMPFRPEGSLTRWLEQRNSDLLPPADVVQIVRQAASALQYAHDQQIIHQDVKPSNFLMRANNERPHLPDVVLADFGVARLSSATSSVSHSIRGTPTYMAPEQWSGEPVSATDQYALAVMTYELLTGHPPFQGPPMRMMYLHTNTPPQLPGTSNPSLPKEVDTVLLTALAKKPEERFVSIAAFARALEQAAQYSDASPVGRAPNFARAREVRATLAISKREAQSGTTRTLNLARGQQVTVAVPAGAYDGQIIRLKDASIGTLIITLSVKETEPTFLPSTPSQSYDKTIPSSNRGILAEPVPPAKRNSKDAVIAAPYNASSASNSPEARPIIIKQQGVSLATAILLVALVVIVLIGGLGFFYLQGINRSSGNNTGSTITTQSTNGAATKPVPQVNTTPTTPSNNPGTPTPVANPYPPHTGTLALNDPLSNNSDGNDWLLYNDAYGSCAFVNGTYHISYSKLHYYLFCTAQTSDFSNFAYQVQMSIIQGDTGGIVFRADNAGLKFYYFHISTDGSYALDLYIDNMRAHSTQLKSGSSPAINTSAGGTNLIAVVATGNNFDLYVNNTHLASVTDSAYSHGQIGLIADSLNNPTEVVFTNAKVWTF